MTVEKPKPKQLLGPITTGAGSAMNQLQFLAVKCNSLEARERSRVHGTIGFDSHWLKNWRESFKPITKRSNRNHEITFFSHLKTALTSQVQWTTYRCLLDSDGFCSLIEKKKKRLDWTSIISCLKPKKCYGGHLGEITFLWDLST